MIDWGKGKERGKREYKVEKGIILSFLTPLTSSDFSFSDSKNIKENNGKIIHLEEEKWETCIINKEIKKVYK